MSDANNPKTVQEWCHAAYKNSKDHGFHDNEENENMAEKLALIHSEISEALEEIRAGRGIDEVYFSDKGKPEGFLVELADAFIRICDIAGSRSNANFEEIVKMKHEYNKSRPHKHGKKF